MTDVRHNSHGRCITALIGRMVSDNAHRMQLGILVAAWFVTFLLGHRFVFRGGDTTGVLFGLGAFGAFVSFAVPVLMRIACPASARAEVDAIVHRSFLRELPENTPADLDDPVQQGWLTADGRPLSAEIAAEDDATQEFELLSSLTAGGVIKQEALDDWQLFDGHLKVGWALRWVEEEHGVVRRRLDRHIDASVRR